MCQLNLYLIPKTVGKDYVLGLMEEYFKDELHECFDSSEIFDNEMSEFNVFMSSRMRCNCGSILGAFQSQEQSSWEKMKERAIDEEYQKCSYMKELLHSENFFKEFKKSQRKNAKTRSLSPEDERLNSAFLDLRFWYLEDIKNKNLETALKKIDRKFSEFKEKYGKEEENEFDNLKKFIGGVLEKTDKMSLMAFWQDAEPYVEIKNKEDIGFDSLKIENLFFLKYNDLLTIRKYV